MYEDDSQFQESGFGAAGHEDFAATQVSAPVPARPKPLHTSEPSSWRREAAPEIVDGLLAIPPEIRNAFNYNYFNKMQSEVFDKVYNTDESMVVGAPTGCGKTVVFELALLRLFCSLRTADAKAIYIAPLKSIVQEKETDWNERLGSFGISCVSVTGDSEIDDVAETKKAQVILTTPEKWDSLTRRWREKGNSSASIVAKTSLVMIDEVHLLNEDRGATLEAIVSRMKIIMKSALMQGKLTSRLRMIALSATIPNIDDLGEWIGAGAEFVCRFGEEYRPVKVEIDVQSFLQDRNDYLFDRNLMYKVFPIIQQQSAGKPTLVFVGTRKGTSETATKILEAAGNDYFVRDPDQRKELERSSAEIQDTVQRELLLHGVACYHSGMEAQDRRIIEKQFLSGNIRVLVSTSSLAQGVNLPAYLVIVKNTKQYENGKMENLPRSAILQMIGRAGRPGFETSGRAVILTSRQTERMYINLASNAETIESNLHRNLIEHINAEICLRTITTVPLALEWLRSTFYFIRVKKAPAKYGLSDTSAMAEIVYSLEKMIGDHLKQLKEHELAMMEDTSLAVAPTDFGILMARYYLTFATMVSFEDVKNSSNLSDLLWVVSRAFEYGEGIVRQTEKKLLNQLNNDGKLPGAPRKKRKRASASGASGGEGEEADRQPATAPAVSAESVGLRFPIPSKIKTVEEKINVLIQSSFSRKAIDDFSLKMEATSIMQQAERVSRCLVDYCLLKRFGNASVDAIILQKCFRQRMWEVSPYVTAQLEGIGESLSKSLASAGVATFQDLEEADPRKLEAVTHRNPPFGTQLKAQYFSIPQYSCTMFQTGAHAADFKDHHAITISVRALRKEEFNTHTTAGNSRSKARNVKRKYHYIIVVSSGGDLLYSAKFCSSADEASSKLFQFAVRKADPKGPKITVHCISEDTIGLDSQRYLNVVYPPRLIEEASNTAPHAAESHDMQGLQSTASPLEHTANSVQRMQSKGKPSNDDIELDELLAEDTSHVSLSHLNGDSSAGEAGSSGVKGGKTSLVQTRLCFDQRVADPEATPKSRPQLVNARATANGAKSDRLQTAATSSSTLSPSASASLDRELAEILNELENFDAVPLTTRDTEERQQQRPPSDETRRPEAAAHKPQSAAPPSLLLRKLASINPLRGQRSSQSASIGGKAGSANPYTRGSVTQMAVPTDAASHQVPENALENRGFGRVPEMSYQQPPFAKRLRQQIPETEMGSDACESYAFSREDDSEVRYSSSTSASKKSTEDLARSVLLKRTDAGPLPQYSWRLRSKGDALSALQRSMHSASQLESSLDPMPGRSSGIAARSLQFSLSAKDAGCREAGFEEPLERFELNSAVPYLSFAETRYRQQQQQQQQQPQPQHPPQSQPQHGSTWNAYPGGVPQHLPEWGAQDTFMYDSHGWSGHSGQVCAPLAPTEPYRPMPRGPFAAQFQSASFRPHASRTMDVFEHPEPLGRDRAIRMMEAHAYQKAKPARPRANLGVLGKPSAAPLHSPQREHFQNPFGRHR
eukprot:ANDGO_05917.mRNA.1 ATP-dependent DNA helicase MER3 homolog